ncbi:hypothetical protein CFHF_08475 [Caulobacter flavus]|uniref:Uncharacterized protein n=1 Tax=Caulobacter flavus TaxID=1679497 RepID=A0A2N5CVL5_9CAUL|nr:hypothetical protein [Caulobacter flavus]AYV46937.1 hypothetical protein C1707_12055 [Caulobacter flavus]PLR17848.1 hypothetical protein CFHF_08475 [Caulobacter flavus]
MWLLALCLSLALPRQEDELLRMHIAPSTWATALSEFDGKPVKRRDVAAIMCVGREPRSMMCGWKQRSRGRWVQYSQYADLSENHVRLLPGERVREAARRR